MTTDRCSHGELMTDPCAACDGYTKAEDSASAPVPAGGTPGGLATEKVDEQQAAVNRADRPATEPLRMALQEVVDQLDDYGPNGPGFARAIEHARSALAEAAQGAAPRVHNHDPSLCDLLGCRDEPPTNVAGGPLLEPHDGGCRCWPHVAQGDALRAVEHAALMEYRSPRAEAAQGAAPRAEGPPMDEALKRAREAYLAPRAEGLDVERLAEAMNIAMKPMQAGRWAPRIAAEYARLSRPSDERVPDSEER